MGFVAALHVPSFMETLGRISYRSRDGAKWAQRAERTVELSKSSRGRKVRAVRSQGGSGEETLTKFVLADLRCRSSGSAKASKRGPRFCDFHHVVAWIQPDQLLSKNYSHLVVVLSE